MAALDWTVKYAAPLLGMVGAFLFGALRLAYVFFYLQLHATPQEVGYGYLEILGGQLAGTVELTVLLTATMVVAGLGVGAVRHAIAGRWRGVVTLPGRAALLRLTRGCALASLAVVLVCLTMLAWTFGTEAKNGWAVRNIYLKFAGRIPVLAVQAVPADVTWTAPQPPPGGPDLRSRRCLLYLGQAGGTAVFYDVASEDSLRIPTAQILLTIPKVKGVRSECFADT
jgi:hypothetical protein